MTHRDRSDDARGTTKAKAVVAAVLAVLTLVGSIAGGFASPASAAPRTHRVLIDTDLGGDPDDIQSLVRAIHYSDILKIEGIVSTIGPGTPRPALIKEWIKRTDVDHLRSKGHGELMSEAALLGTVKVGSQTKGAPSNRRSTDGSRHLIARAHAGSANNPLWVLAWGSMTTIAQALHDDPTIASKIRIYSIGDYNSTADLASRDFVLDFLDSHRSLWWVENGVMPRESRSTFRGVWRGGNQSGEWNRKTFLHQNIRGHGTNGDGEFSQKMGDAFPLANSPHEAIGSLKEGDSPSLLYLLSSGIGGVGNVDNPTGASWGGQFRRASSKYPNYYVDLNCSTKEACQATINKYRVAQLSDWKARWDRYNGGTVEAPAPTTPTTKPAAPQPAPGTGGTVLTVADATVTERGTGQWLTFRASLSKAVSTTVTVAYATSDGSAKQPSDYKAAKGTITIPARRTSGYVNVWVHGDGTAEADETFTLQLTKPAGATLAATTVTGTIRNDDGGTGAAEVPAPPTTTAPEAPAPTVPSGSGPVITIDDQELGESARGRWMTFTAELSKASSSKVAVDFTTADGTAKQPSDYRALDGTLTFAPGDTKAWVNVWIAGDRTREATEDFTVELRSPVGASLGDSAGNGRIVNDD